MTAQIFHQVKQIVSELIEGRCSANDITWDMCLIELGLDSLTLVDLAGALEDALGIHEFPLQEWADAEACRRDNAFTIGSLVETCSRLVAEGSTAEARVAE